MRVLAANHLGPVGIAEAKRAGVTDGFGVRLQEEIAKAEANALPQRTAAPAGTLEANVGHCGGMEDKPMMPEKRWKQDHTTLADSDDEPVFTCPNCALDFGAPDDDEPESCPNCGMVYRYED
jgi:hypothetical protein